MIPNWYRLGSVLKSWHLATLLSPQQRQIAIAIAKSQQEMNVKELARTCNCTTHTLAGQLRHLKEMGAVQSRSVGKYSYYSIVDRELKEYLQTQNTLN
jgi:predicted transcriptional regulator